MTRGGVAVPAPGARPVALPVLVAAVLAADLLGVALVLTTATAVAPVSWIVVWTVAVAVAIAGPLALRVAQLLVAVGLTVWVILRSDPAVLATLQILVFALGAVLATLAVAVRHDRLHHAVAATLQRAADTDPLTGVLNRRGFARAAAALLAPGRGRTAAGEWSVLALDVRGLKTINDRQGHGAGDQRLVEVAHALRDTVGAAGVAARTGGDEFVALLPRQRADAVVAALRSGPLAGAVRLGRADGAPRSVEQVSALLHDADRDAGSGEVGRAAPPPVTSAHVPPPAAPTAPAATGSGGDRTLFSALLLLYATLALVGAALRVARGEASPARTLVVGVAQLLLAVGIVLVARRREEDTRSLGTATLLTLVVLGVSSVVTTNAAIGSAGVLAWALPVLVGARIWSRSWLLPVVGWIVVCRVYVGIRVEDSVPEGVLVGAVQALALVVLVGWVRRLQAAQEHARAELVVVAGTDPLTGALNRWGVQQAAAGWCDGRTVTVSMLDIDGFKRVNDTAGHAAGDAVLVAVAAALRGAAPDGSLVARLGGDEFVVVSDGPPREWSRELAHRLRGSVAAVSMSIGSATGAARDPDQLWALIDEADRRLVTGRPPRRRR